MCSLLRLERKQKSSSKSFRIRIFHTLPDGSLENHTQFQTKMGKAYTRFQAKTAQKLYPMGRHMPI